jgi:CRP-like cAMP-binding protein
VADVSDLTLVLKETYPFLSEEDIVELLSISKVRKVSNKTVLIKGGEISKKIYFIAEGLIRGYFTNEKGVEKNIFLRPDKTVTGAPNSLFNKTPAKYTFEAVGDCLLLEYEQSDFERLSSSNSRFIKMYIEGLHEVIKILIFRVESLIDKMPEERYEQLISTHPQFFQKAYNKHIANYLGITSVSLSRIIKRKLDNRN